MKTLIIILVLLAIMGLTQINSCYLWHKIRKWIKWQIRLLKSDSGWIDFSSSIRKQVNKHLNQFRLGEIGTFKNKKCHQDLYFEALKRILSSEEKLHWYRQRYYGKRR